jgi:hypothetical protein
MSIHYALTLSRLLLLLALVACCRLSNSGKTVGDQSLDLVWHGKFKYRLGFRLDNI